jgi:hypothetical protein
MTKAKKNEESKLALTIKERLLVPQLYPREAGLTDQTIVRDIARKVNLSQEEQKKVGLKTMPNGFTWDNKKEKVIEVEFTDAEINLLKDRINKLDQEKKITQQLVELCLKIKNV